MPRTRSKCAATAAAAESGKLDVLQPGDECMYTTNDAHFIVKVLKTHHDDEIPYYTISWDGGARERETIRSRLELLKRPAARPSRSPARERERPTTPLPPRTPPPPPPATPPPPLPSRSGELGLVALSLAGLLVFIGVSCTELFGIAKPIIIN